MTVNDSQERALGVGLGQRCNRGGGCGGAIRINPISEYAYCTACGWEEGDARFADDFNGDDARLLESIEALLDLDKRGALTPHGLGGHGRTLLSAAAHRLGGRLERLGR
jgi:hypothetical protein